MAKNKILKKSYYEPKGWLDEEIADEFLDEFGVVDKYEFYRALSFYNLSGFSNFW